MSERGCDKKPRPPPAVVSQSRKRPPSTSKAERSKKIEVRPAVRSASAPAKKPTDDFWVKEEQYKLLNAELEAKTAEIVRQAEQLMRDRSEALSRPMSTLLLTDIEDEEDSRIIKSHRDPELDPSVKVLTKKKVTSMSQNMGRPTGTQEEPHCKTQTPLVDGLDHSADFSLAEAIRSMETKTINSATLHGDVVDDVFGMGDNVASGISDAQIRLLRAKLRIMQEELDQLTSDYYKKDDENAKLSGKIKNLEEERARLQKTTSIQKTQIEKHRALADESAKKCDGLQLQVSALNKDIENMTRSHKQAAAVHSTVEVRLNRALEEVERMKAQLDKTKQTNKDKISEEHQSKENLLAENKMLKKQKSELIVGFKKQLKLIDILKRQKMHFEAAKLLSFTEDEFMRALDWGTP